MSIIQAISPTTQELQAMFEQTGIFSSYDSEEGILLNCYDSDNVKRLSISSSYSLTFYGDNFTKTTGTSSALNVVKSCKGAVIFYNSATMANLTYIAAVTTSSLGRACFVLLPQSSSWGTQSVCTTTSNGTYAIANQILGGFQLYDYSTTTLIPFTVAPGADSNDYTNKLFLSIIYQTYLNAGPVILQGKTYLQVGRWFALDE